MFQWLFKLLQSKKSALGEPVSVVSGDILITALAKGKWQKVDKDLCGEFDISSLPNEERTEFAHMVMFNCMMKTGEMGFAHFNDNRTQVTIQFADPNNLLVSHLQANGIVTT